MIFFFDLRSIKWCGEKDVLKINKYIMCCVFGTRLNAPVSPLCTAMGVDNRGKFKTYWMNPFLSFVFYSLSSPFLGNDVPCYILWLVNQCTRLKSLMQSHKASEGIYELWNFFWLMRHLFCSKITFSGLTKQSPIDTCNKYLFWIDL